MPLEGRHTIDKNIEHRETAAKRLETRQEKIGEAAAKNESQLIIEQRAHILRDTSEVKGQEPEYQKK